MGVLSAGFFAGVLLLPSAIAQGLTAEQIPEAVSAAQQAMQDKAWSTANFYWKSVLNTVPANRPARLGYARSLLESGLTADAVAVLEAGRGFFKQDVDYQLLLADAYTRAGQPPQAEIEYLNVLMVDRMNVPALQGLKAIQPLLPDSEQAQLKLVFERIEAAAREKAQAMYADGRYDQMVQPLAVMVTQSNRAGTVNNYGVALLLTDQYRQAAEQFGRIISTGLVQDWRLWSNAGLVALSQGKTVGARQWFEQAITRASDDKTRARLFNHLGYAFEMAGKGFEAKAAYRQALTLDPQCTKAAMNLGFLYVRDRLYPDAVDVYKRLLAAQSDSAETWNQLGFAYEMWGRPRPALHAYRQALVLNPGYRDAAVNLATLYQKMNRLKDAENTFREVLTHNVASLASAKASPSASPPAVEPKLLKYVDVFWDEALLRPKG